MSNYEDNKRLAVNTAILYIRTLVVLLVQLYLARVLLEVLGVIDYGIYNVVASVVVLFAFINAAMTQSSQRFITYELGKNDNGMLMKIFNVSMTLQFSTMILFVVLAESLGLWFLNYRLNIPAERMTAANIAYQFSILLFSINVIKVPYVATVIAYEKMSFFAYASLLDAFLKLGIAFSLWIIPGDKLVAYCYLLVAEALLIFSVLIIYSHKNFLMCRFKFVRDWDLYKRMYSFMGWSLCGSFSDVATQKGFTFMVNIFYGVAVNAALGIGNQVSGAIKAFINSFQTSFKPQIVKAYAVNDFTRLHALINETSKFSFLLIFLPSVVCIVNMPLLLGIWLKEVPEYTVDFCRMLVICAIFDATSSPFYCAIMSLEKIRNYQLVISSVFVLDLIVSYLLMNWGISPANILWSRIATRGLVNCFVGLFFMKQKIKFSLSVYFLKVIAPIAIGITIVLFPLYFMKSFTPIYLLIGSTLYLSLSVVVVGYFVILDKSERMLVRKMLKI